MPVGNIKTYILDASFVLAFLLPDEHQKQVNSIFKQYAAGEANFLSCFLLPYEVVNGLKNALGKRINKQEAINLIQDFNNLSIEFYEIDFAQVLKLSLENNLSIYDASYVFLAKQKNCSLLTLDKKLLAALN